MKYIFLDHFDHIAKFFSEPFGNKCYFSYSIAIKAVPWDLKMSVYCTKYPLFRVHDKPMLITSLAIYSGPSYPTFTVL